MQQQFSQLVHDLGFSHGQWHIITLGLIWMGVFFALAFLIHILNHFKDTDLENFIGILGLTAMVCMLFFTFVATPTQADVRHNQTITNQIDQVQKQLTKAQKQKVVQQTLMEKGKSKADIDKYADSYLVAKQHVVQLQQKIAKLQNQKVEKLMDEQGHPNPNFRL